MRKDKTNMVITV